MSNLRGQNGPNLSSSKKLNNDSDEGDYGDEFEQVGENEAEDEMDKLRRAMRKEEAKAKRFNNKQFSKQIIE